MTISSNNLQLTTDQHGQIISIKFHDYQVLHDGKKAWAKIYPMIWPNISYSRGFVVNHKNYQLPKHGFWNQLDWKTFYEDNTLTQTATSIANDTYPFSIDIQNQMTIVDDQVIVKTIFSNVGKTKAWFHFGHHPAFVIDDTSIIDAGGRLGQQIDLNGKLRRQTVKWALLKTMKFGIDYDTLVIKDWLKPVKLINQNYTITVDSPQFESIQIWKPTQAPFVCLEPWQGYNDDEYQAPQAADQKLDIIELESGQVTSFVVTYQFQLRT